MSSIDILIADDESDLRSAIRSQLSPRGYRVDEASDGQQAWEMIQAKDYDLVLLDVRMPRLDGLQVLKKIRDSRATTSVAIITAQATISDAVQAIHDGAFDYIEKPLNKERLDQLVDKALEARRLVEQIAFSRPLEGEQSLVVNDPKQDFVGHSAPMQRVFKLIDKLANINTTVLIRGENGTGKELVARAIHYNSPRKHRPFVAISCSAIEEAALDSEFFGHEKGAFSGADQRHIGKFQIASGGTLFLDEIENLSLTAQLKLLKAFEEQRILPLGATRDVKVDLRIIAATSVDLEELMNQGRFRNDLFYKLNVMPLFLPALKDRLEDIPLVADHYVKRFNQKHLRQIRGLSSEALEKLKIYDWPGNIREFENAIEHAFVIEPSDTLSFDSFPDLIKEAVLDREEGWRLPKAEIPLSLNYQQDKERFEKEFISQALKNNQGRINQTCENAKIPKNTLLRKMKKYGISAKDH